MLDTLLVPLFAAAALQAGAPPPPAVEAPVEAPPLSLSRLLERAMERNPDLVALDEARAAAAERAVAAGSMPHPMVGFALTDVPVDSFSLDEDMMTMKEISIRQRLPWFGKRGLRREVAAKNATLVEAERAARELLLQQGVVEAYANLWLAIESAELVREQEQALERFARIVRGRYAAGGGAQSDLLRADMELARIREPLMELQTAEWTARSALATLLSLPLAALEGKPEVPPLLDLPEDPEPFLARIEAHPELRALAVQAEQSEAEARLQERERWPDPEVGLMYGERAMGSDMVGIEVMFAVPVFAASKENRLAAAARADARAIRARAVGRADALRGEAQGAWAAARQQRELVRLYEEEILPRARRNLESATGSYQAGLVDFLTLLDARVQLQMQQLEALRARAGYVRQLARFARATGVSLFREGAAAEVSHD